MNYPASHLDYKDIEHDTKALTNRMRAFIMAQNPSATVIGKRICVTLPLEMVSEECKKAKKRK